MTTSQEREARGSRRPITASELPHLLALGGLIRYARHQARLTRRALGDRAGVSADTIDRIESGTRRTRRSTLARLASVLHEANVTLGEPSTLLDAFVDAAGPALAAESEWASRIDRRRARRAAKRAAIGRGQTNGG